MSRCPEVVDGVGDVVAPVHHLRLEAASLAGRALAQPGEHVEVVVVDAELARARLPRPGVLRGGVEGRAREVEPHRAAGARAVVGAERLGLEPGQDPQRLRVALEAADGCGHLVERVLAVVPEGRVPEVVRQARDLDEVGVAAERGPELAPDLGALQGVGEPGAQEVALPRSEHLGLGGPAAQRRRVQHARPVTGERRAAGALGRLEHPPRLVVGRVAERRPVVVVRLGVHRGDSSPQRRTGQDATTGAIVRRSPTQNHARPADSRAR